MVLLAIVLAGIAAITAAYAALSTAPTKTWYWQNPVPQGNRLYGIDAPGGSHVWAVGESGVILHSTDDGAQWEPQDSNTAADLTAVDFIDTQTGWVVGDSGTVRATSDGGSTWTTQTASGALRGVSMADAHTGWIVGSGGGISKTSNGGSNWIAVPSPVSVVLNGVSAVDSTHAWAVGGSGAIVSTTDGSTWTTQTATTTQTLNAVSFTDNQTGYAVGFPDVAAGKGTVIKTTNGGMTWNALDVEYLNANAQLVGLNETLRSVSFRDADTGWIVGDSGLVLYTENGGAAWVQQKSGTRAMYGVAASDGTKGHLVGDSGIMLRTDNDGQNWRGQQQGTTIRLNSGAWTGPDSGVVVGATGLVMKTEDSGVSWAGSTISPDDLYSVAFADSTDGWIVGSGGFVGKTTDAGATWVDQDSGTTQTLYSVATINDYSAWAVGSGGTILKTVSGGTTWYPKPSNTTEHLYDVFFLDSDYGWTVGSGGTILKTSDGGEQWTPQTSGVTSSIHSVHFTTVDTGWFSGANGILGKTSDGGSTWTMQTSGTSQTLYSIEMADSNTGWAVGGSSTGSAVVRTTDGGTTWSAQDAGFEGILRYVSARGPSLANIVGDVGAIRRTSDGGATWETNGFWSTANFRDLAFPTNDKGWAVGQRGTIARTLDGGRTWGTQQSGGVQELWSVDFVSENKGWAVGASGAIRSTLTDGTWGSQDTGITSTLYGVDFFDHNRGWTVGEAGVILNTVDGGSNWSSQVSNVSSSTSLWGVSSVDTQTAIAWGDGGTIAKTTDGGITWNATSISEFNLYAGSFVDTQTGWVAGASGTLMKTTDGGQNWSSQDANVDGTELRGVWFRDASNGYLVGLSGTVRKTADGGVTWHVQTPGTGNALHAVEFTDADTGWLVGTGGTILRTTDNTPPETVLVIDPAEPDGSNGWFVNKPQISFVSSEPGLTYFSWSSETVPWTTFSSPVIPPEDGEQTVHWYSVDAGGNEEAVQSMTAKIDESPPSTPSTPAVSAQSESEMLLTWSPSVDFVSGLAHYEIRNFGSVIGTSPVESATLSELSPETLYSLSITAVDIAGNVSGESGEVVASTYAEVSRPPFAIHAADAGGRGIVVNWVESTGTVAPVSYRVWRSAAGATFSAIATIGPGEDRSYEDTAAPRLQELRYGISVVDARGEGPMSANSNTTLATPRLLPAPTGLRARNTASVTLTWTPSPLADAYHVYRAVTSTDTATTLTVTPTEFPTYHDSTTEAYTEYWYSVATVDASENVGPPSPRVYIRTEPEASSTTTSNPHGGYTTDTNLCAACHRAHSASSPLLLTGTSTIDAPLCLSCHDGTSASDILTEFSDPSRSSRHPVPVEGWTGTLQCSSCHGVHSLEQTDTVNGMLRSGSVKSGNEFCYTCHGSADSAPRGNMSVFESSSHSTGVVEPPSGTKVVCLSCHVGHSSREASLYPYSGDDRCLGCHSSSVFSESDSDIASKLSGDGPGTRHDLLSQDSSATGSRLGCSNCHEPHTSTATTPCVDPDSPTTTNTISASGVTLCLRCHDGALPTSEDTSGWASAPLAAGGETTTTDIKTLWNDNFHGGGASDSPELKLGYEMGDKLACSNCHDAHGSMNRYSLKESVSGTRTTSALTADSLTVAAAGDGWDLRFFCDSCHDITVESHDGIADLLEWPTDCTGCHNHASGL